MEIQEIRELTRLKFAPKQGVYFLFNGKVIVYIGQSADIDSRVKQHLSDKVFDSYAFITIEDPKARLDKESFLILKHNPPYNQTVPQKKVQKLKSFCHFYNVDTNNILEVLERDGITPVMSKRVRDPLNATYFVKDLAPYVNYSKNETQEMRKLNYAEIVKKVDAGRNIIQHHEDAKRLMKGLLYDKPLFTAILKVTTYYQKGFTLDDAIRMVSTDQIKVTTLIELLTKEPGYLEKKRYMYEEIQDELVEMLNTNEVRTNV